MRVTSGPGVPTGGSLPHATASFRAPSSADERFDVLQSSRDRTRFQVSVSQRCRPEIQAIFGHPRFFPAREIGGYGGDVGDEMQRGVAIAYSPRSRRRGDSGNTRNPEGSRRLAGGQRSATTGGCSTKRFAPRQGCRKSNRVACIPPGCPRNKSPSHPVVSASRPQPPANRCEPFGFDLSRPAADANS